MPTYDFRCPAGHDFERFFRKISEAPAEFTCPQCGQQAVRQVSGGAGLLFKGSGFYITDYGKDGKKDQRAAAKKSEGSTSEGKSSDTTTSSDQSSKSASKSEKKSDSGKPSSGGGSSTE
jgi:putative FmdB family regulatory protein